MKISKLDSNWKDDTTLRGNPWQYRDLSEERLGVRLEELSPGANSSEHHYHTAEEEHVIVLEGQGSLVYGDEIHPVVAGDHFWSKAGKAVPHHLKNTSASPLKYLVFGA